MTVVGVDACRRGWVAVELVEGAFVAAHLAASFAELIERVPDAAAVAVDMPAATGSPSGRRCFGGCGSVPLANGTGWWRYRCKESPARCR